MTSKEKMGKDFSGPQFMISIQTFGSAGLAEMRESVRTAARSLSLNSISSVYRMLAHQSHDGGIHDLKSVRESHGLCVNAMGSTVKSLEKLHRLIVDVESYLRSKQGLPSTKITLLLFANETLMTPELTIPHPELHTTGEFLAPASEIAPDWQHPVFQKKLVDLHKELRNPHWGEFFAQGKSLLDFDSLSI